MQNSYKGWKALFFFLAVISLIGIFRPFSFAGTGKIVNSQFNLSVSVRYDATQARLDELKSKFEKASNLLFDATDGQHQLGTTLVCNNSRGGKNADIWILPGGDGTTKRSYVNIPIPGLGAQGRGMHLYDFDLNTNNVNADGSHVIVHELGHYGYGIYDEYAGPDGPDPDSEVEPAECIVDTTNPASLMDNFWIKPTSEFCVSSNHDHGLLGDPDTLQSAHNTRSDGTPESSWETIKKYFPALNIPLLPENPPQVGPATFQWKVLDPETRVILAIDRSGSMIGSRINNAKLGAKLFVDLVSPGDKIGVVSFSNAASTNYPLTKIANDSQITAKNVIDSLMASGATAMGSGLRTALNQILAAGEPGCQQVIILLSDGMFKIHV